MCEMESFTNVVIAELEKRLEAHDKNRIVIQEAIDAECQRRIKEVEELGAKVREELEEQYVKEDERLQRCLNEVRTAAFAQAQSLTKEASDRVGSALDAAVAELLVVQSYALDLPKLHLKTLRVLDPPPLDLRSDPAKAKVACPRVLGFEDGGVLVVDFNSPFTQQEKDVLTRSGLDATAGYRVAICNEARTCVSEAFFSVSEDRRSFLPGFLSPETSYCLKVRAELGESWHSEWNSGDASFFRTPDAASLFSWRQCVEGPVAYKRMYSTSPAAPRLATKVNRYGDTTVLGNVALSTFRSSTWRIKLCASVSNTVADGVYVGVAPFDIDQNRDKNETTCGWYLRCFDMALFSGPPHRYKQRPYYYGSGKPPHLCIGDEISVTFNPSTGISAAMSFGYKDHLTGNAYEKIPLDKPLVPAVLLYWVGDTVDVIFDK